MASIEIADNGEGIKPEYQDKIFDMFFRVNHKTQGSGLGLYIVKETISKMNGAIVVESEQNAGTSFKIELPTLN